MTPEQDIERIIAAIHPDCGHWPFERDSDLYVGWRAGEEAFTPVGSNNPVRAVIVYDVAIGYARQRIAEAERLRYALYQALKREGWKLRDNPGPETYIAKHDLRIWPFSVVKGFALDKDGMPNTEMR